MTNTIEVICTNALVTVAGGSNAIETYDDCIDAHGELASRIVRGPDVPYSVGHDAEGFDLDPAGDKASALAEQICTTFGLTPSR